MVTGGGEIFSPTGIVILVLGILFTLRLRLRLTII